MPNVQWQLWVLPWLSNNSCRINGGRRHRVLHGTTRKGDELAYKAYAIRLVYLLCIHGLYARSRTTKRDTIDSLRYKNKRKENRKEMRRKRRTRRPISVNEPDGP